MTRHRSAVVPAAPAPPMSPAEQAADKILRAAGSALRHYELASRQKIVAAAAEMIGEWLPIDSAPKNGTWFWAFFPFKSGEETQGLCHWRNRQGWSDLNLVINQPSHWRPLPSPPAPPAGDATP